MNIIQEKRFCRESSNYICICNVIFLNFLCVYDLVWTETSSDEDAHQKNAVKVSIRLMFLRIGKSIK
jgi:hypothetical protein